MLVPTNTIGFPSIVQAQVLELKKLLAHLKYAYLGNNQTLPMIIGLELSLGEEEKFLRVLRDHNTSLGWTIADIKGISSSKCMHKILLENEARPTRDYIDYRRLNKETRKWDLGSTLTMVVKNYTSCAEAHLPRSVVLRPHHALKHSYPLKCSVGFLFLFYFLFSILFSYF